MKNSKRFVLALILLAFAVVGVCAQTQSQASLTSDRQISVILQRLERSSSKFRYSLNSSLVRSRIDQTRPENDINTFEPGFGSATQKFKSQFGRHSAGVADVENILRQASLINGFMALNRLERQVQRDWALVRSDLNGLARAYGVDWVWNQQTMPPIYASGSTSVSDRDLNQLIQFLETGGNTFRSSLTEAFDQTGYDQTSGEGRMNNALRGLKKETDQLRIRFDARQPVTASVASLLVLATPIDTYMHGNLLTNRVQNDWRTLRGDIDKLASAFNLSANWQNE
jgi:hypothetical protein